MQPLKTAMITGASEGIGKCFAEIFAKNGHDLVLVARNADKLHELAAELSAQYEIEVHVFATDLIPMGSAKALFEKLALKNIRVDILVNNSGMIPTEYSKFGEYDVSVYGPDDPSCPG
jgi:short-subunit dehydrogenase